MYFILITLSPILYDLLKKLKKFVKNCRTPFNTLSISYNPPASSIIYILFRLLLFLTVHLSLIHVAILGEKKRLNVNLHTKKKQPHNFLLIFKINHDKVD